MSDGREDEQSGGIEDKYRAQGQAYLAVVGLYQRADGCNGTASADSRSAGDQVRGLFVHGQLPSQECPQGQGESDAEDGQQDAFPAGLHGLVGVDAEAETHDGDFQQGFYRFPAQFLERIAHRVGYDDPGEKRQGG